MTRSAYLIRKRQEFATVAEEGNILFVVAAKPID